MGGVLPQIPVYRHYGITVTLVFVSVVYNVFLIYFGMDLKDFTRIVTFFSVGIHGFSS